MDRKKDTTETNLTNTVTDASTDTTETTAGTDTTTKAKGNEPFEVAMADGKMVQFSGKRKMLKSAISDPVRGIGVRLDFVNGEFREFFITEALLHRFAVHGAEQKLGDEIAGVDLVEDCVAAIDELIDRLYNGDWTVKREPNALNGASILAKALVEVSGKTIEQVRSYLSKLDAKQKLALRANKDVAPVVAKLEALRKPKEGKKPMDTDDLLAALSAAPAPTSLIGGTAPVEETAAG